MDFAGLPKIELHLHLDCSLSYDVVKKLRPETSWEEYHASFIAPPKCTDLADYITRAIKGVALMQTEEALSAVCLDLFQQLKADKVVYAEIRFAPLLHTEGGLSPTEVVDIVNRATENGIKKTGIQAGLILCTLRHYEESQSLATIKLVEQFKGTRVVGFDIAADESGFPIDNHIEAFRYAHSKGIPCTAHAGEAKGPTSVWETLENLRPQRIGHGVRSAEDKKLLAYLKSHDIHLEVCPTSNVQTNVFPTIREHSCTKIYQSGVSMSINTDARTISNVSLTDEYQLLAEVFAWEKQHFLNCNLEAIRHAFISEPEKRRLSQLIREGFEA